jgi:hypothetical protein
VTSVRDLGFPEQVRSRFRFLEAEYGFALSENAPTLVSYLNDRMFVRFYHGRRSYELGLELGRVGRPDEEANPFRMSDLIGTVDADAGRRYRSFSASNRENLKRGLDRVLEDLREYGRRALAGDHSVFDEMERRRQLWTDEFAAEVNNARVRSLAEAAWSDRDFRRVAELLGSIESSLSRAERLKLEYARRR